MTLHLLLQTLTTSTKVKSDVVVFWQNQPAFDAQRKPKHLIDATPLTLEQIYKQILSYGDAIENVALIGLDVLIPLKQSSLHTILTFIRTVSATFASTTVVINTDDALRHSEHEVLLKTLCQSASSITALRGLPSGRDKEFAGLVRITRGVSCNSEPGHDHDIIEGQRLYRYNENMMGAII